MPQHAGQIRQCFHFQSLLRPQRTIQHPQQRGNALGPHHNAMPARHFPGLHPPRPQGSGPGSMGGHLKHPQLQPRAAQNLLPAFHFRPRRCRQG